MTGKVPQALPEVSRPHRSPLVVVLICDRHVETKGAGVSVTVMQIKVRDAAEGFEC